MAAASCFLLCARARPPFSLPLPNSRLPLRFDYVCLAPQPRRRSGAAAAAMKTIMANSSLSFSYGEFPDHDAPLECLPSDATEEVT